MKWSKTIAQKVKWNNDIINRAAKEKVVQRIVAKVKNGDIIGFGSGSTAFLAIQEIAKKIAQENLEILAIPTSFEIEMLCRNLNITTTTLNDQRPDWGFDGADEVNEQNWLIKGRGGAMFKEKMIMSCSEITYILVDDSKFVKNLGEKFAIPIECVPESLNMVRQRIADLGATSMELRLAGGKDGPVITEHGNLILDVRFPKVTEELGKELISIVGVVETGLFIGYNIEVITT